MSGWRRVDYIAVEAFIDGLLEVHKSGEREGRDERTKLKQSVLKATLAYQEGVRDWLKKALDVSRKLIDEIQKGFSAAGYNTIKLRFRLVSPGLVGTGSGLLKPIFEAGLSIHPLLGLPYYPGSGVKGALRAFSETLFGIKVAEAIFGSAGERGSAGAIVVSDMLPVGCARDKCSIYRGLVLAPHYHRGGKAVPNELYAVPTPIPHIGIEEDTLFDVVIAVHPLRAQGAYKVAKERFRHNPLRIDEGLCRASRPEAQLYKNLCDTLKKIVDNIEEADRAIAAMTYMVLSTVLELGIGARPTKGYNIFEIFEDKAETIRFSIVGYSYEPPRHSKQQGQQHRRRERPVERRAGRMRGHGSRRWQGRSLGRRLRH